MSTLRISNIEAKSVPASATIDEKVKITNSSGDTLVFIDGKTSGITTIGINTTDGNIKFDENSNVVVTGIITATRFSGEITPTSLEIGSNIKLGNAGVITATSFNGSLAASNLTGALPAISGANLTNLPSQVSISSNADNRVITGGSGVNLNAETNFTFDGNQLTVNGILDVNGAGTQFNGGTGNNGANDAVVYIDKNDNNDWCLKLKPNNGNSTNYGMIIEAENATGQAFVIRNSDDSNNNQFFINGEGDYFTGNSYPRTDANKDLGFRSGYRWRDLILSGGVQLGGTGTANYIDDYEEGTWTPVLGGYSSISYHNPRIGYYTKIGDVVHFTAYFYVYQATGANSNVTISLPFTSKSDSARESGAYTSYDNGFFSGSWNEKSGCGYLIGSNYSTIRPIKRTNGAVIYGNDTALGTGANNRYLIVAGTMFAN